MQSQFVFISGAPRSGTTALTRLLMAHESVVLADAQVLGTSPDGAPSYESGIFVRGFSDQQVISRFQKIDGLAPIILEKTPSHIMHLDRIRNLFPKAKFIFPYRPAQDSLRSWKVAKKTFLKNRTSFAKACDTWANASRTIISEFDREDVHIIDYNEFISDVSHVGEQLFSFLDLDSSRIKDCIAEMRNDRNLRVEGAVGESIKGGKTSFTLNEYFQVVWRCQRVERSWARLHANRIHQFH